MSLTVRHTGNARRNQKILRRRKEKSFSLIAKELGVTRNVVAGVIWRRDWPYADRTSSGPGNGNHSCGEGHSGPGRFARRTLLDLRAEAQS